MSHKKASDPSEVVLKVRRRIVRAKKEVLIKESKYFEALFSGNFADSGSQEINFTKDVDDMNIFKSVIEFLGHGYIFLDENNLEEVLHLSTYLQIDNLKDRCVEYIKATMNCSKWLRYHFYAMDNGLVDVQCHTDTIVHSRFHDLLMFEKETLNLSPDQLDYLSKNGYMKYCPFQSLLLFVANWLCISVTVDNRKLAVAVEILNSSQKAEVEKTMVEEDLKKLNKVYSELKELLKAENSELVDQLLEMFNNKNKGKIESETVCENKSVLAIFTLSERRYLPGKTNEAEESVVAHVCDVCVYSKTSDHWYHIATFDEKEYMGQFSDYAFNWTEEPFEPLDVEMIACDSHVIFVDTTFQREALIFHLKEKTWKTFSFREHLEHQSLDDERIRTLQFIVGRNNSVYLLVCIKLMEEDYDESDDESDDVPMIYVRLYQLDLASLEFDEICETFPAESVPHCNDWHRFLRNTNVHISEGRKELIVCHSEGSGLNFVFTVNLDSEVDNNGKVRKNEGEYYSSAYTNPIPKIVLKEETRVEHNLFREVDLVECDDKYLLLTKEDTCDSKDLIVSWQYSFETETLMKVVNGGTHRLSGENDRVGDKTQSLCEGCSFWQIEQKLRYGNVFQEVRYKDTGNPEVIKRRPPPFTKIISASSASVDQAFFKDLTPVKHFLYT